MLVFSMLMSVIIMLNECLMYSVIGVLGCMLCWCSVVVMCDVVVLSL